MFNFIKKIFSKKEVEPIENEPEEIIFPISLKINIDKNLIEKYIQNGMVKMTKISE